MNNKEKKRNYKRYGVCDTSLILENDSYTGKNIPLKEIIEGVEKLLSEARERKLKRTLKDIKNKTTIKVKE